MFALRFSVKNRHGYEWSREEERREVGLAKVFRG
jgi:hypothetical protein